MSKSIFFSEAAKHKLIITLILAIVLSLSLLSLTGCGLVAQKEAQDGVPGVNKSQIYAGNPTGAVQLTLPAKMALSFDRKIIQNADISLQVKAVPTAVDKILNLCKKNGGYTVNSHIYRNADRVSANLSVKVPQQKLNSIIASVSTYGYVTDKVITSEDVTEEYYDSEARLKVMTAKEERLLILMNKASNITDVISIENELGKTRSEIEVLTGRLKYLSNATDYSLININLEQAVAGAVKAPQGTLGKSAQGLVNSLNQLINFASNLVVLLFILLPWVVMLVLLFFLVRYIYKKRKARVSKE